MLQDQPQQPAQDQSQPQQPVQDQDQQQQSAQDQSQQLTQDQQVMQSLQYMNQAPQRMAALKVEGAIIDAKVVVVFLLIVSAIRFVVRKRRIAAQS